MASALSRTPHPYNEVICDYKSGSSERVALESELDRLQAEPVNIPLIIAGERRFNRETIEICSPQNKKQVLAISHRATEQDVKDAIASCVEARKTWAQLAWEERAAVFLKAADLISSKYRSRLNAATMLGQSKTCHQAEIDASCELADFFRFNAYFAAQIYAEQPMYSPMGQWNRMSSRALEGFVLALTPFNFTSIAINLAASPALMGCSVLWKPSETSMLSSYVGMELLEEAGMPPGVINFISGDPQLVGSTALASPDFSGMHFTGSTQTFDKLWGEVGKNVSKYKSYPRIVGETGGKDFVFAHKSCDTDSLVISLVRGAFEFQGQKCSAASRAYIPASIWPQVKEGLIQQTTSIEMGDPLDYKNFMGAVIDQNAFNKVKSFIDHAAESKDAEILCGGECDDKKGFFIRPTIIQTTNPSYKAMVEEAFGPVLCIYVYEDDKMDETLKLCDESTPYALTGAIFAKDRAVIASLSSALEQSAGNFYINDKPSGAVVGQQPFGGGRKSGTNDKAGSVFNLLRWVSPRTIKENFISPVDYRYPYMQE